MNAPVSNRNLGQGVKRERAARYDLKARDLKVRVAGTFDAAPAVIKVSALRSAAECIGPILPGCNITGLTNGQFSLVDIIEYVLAEIGPADMALSTWTTGIYDEKKAVGFYANGNIRRARVVVDPLIFERRPEKVGPMVGAFGIDSFRAVTTHAKFCILTNERYAVAIRGSMNLNRNPRIENFDLTESREVAGIFLRLVDLVFEQPHGAKVRSHEFFAKLCGEVATAAAVPDAPAEEDAIPGLGGVDLESLQELQLAEMESLQELPA